MTPQEREQEGVRVLQDAFRRWSEQPPALVELSKISVYQLIMGLQLATRHPDVPPASLQAWQSIGQQLTEAICDTAEIYAMTQAGWDPDFDVDQEEPADIPVRRLVDGRWQTVEITLSEFRANEGADGRTAYRVKADAPKAWKCVDCGYEDDERSLICPNCATDGELMETEEQPPAADATVDLTKPFCYRIDRPAEHRPEGEFMMCWGSYDAAPGPFTQVHHAATYEAARARVDHAYRGPMTVRVWQRRETEHYRTEPPADAYRLELGDRSDSLKTAADLIESLAEAEKGGKL